MTLPACSLKLFEVTLPFTFLYYLSFLQVQAATVEMEDMVICCIHHSNAVINVKPELGGGGPRAYVRHLITIAISTLGNLTESLGPRVGTLDFLGVEDWALIACCLKAAILKCEEWGLSPPQRFDGVLCISAERSECRCKS